MLAKKLKIQIKQKQNDYKRIFAELENKYKRDRKVKLNYYQDRKNKRLEVF